MTKGVQERLTDELASERRSGMPVYEIMGVTHDGWLDGIRMIDRVEVLRLYAYCHGIVTVFDNVGTLARKVPKKLKSFDKQIKWLIDNGGPMDRFENNPYPIIEQIDGGVMLAFIGEHIYVKIVEQSLGNDRWFVVTITAVFGTPLDLRRMTRLLSALTRGRTWIDKEPDNKVVSAIGFIG